ncbi:MAG: carboxypeptidase regulatory-like domain-containing protein, partial [Roseiflexaceae bacterium]
MKTRLLPPNGLLAGFTIALLFLSTLPVSRASPPVPGQGYGPTVSGRVIANGVPIAYVYVWVAPKDAQGVLDYQNARETWTDANGIFTFTNMPPGDYSMDIEPDCVPDALPLIGRIFTVLAGPLNLGDVALPPASLHIQGTVRRAGAPVVEATVVAFNTEDGSYRCAVTNPNGQYRLGVSSGEWVISVDPEPGELWMFTQTPPVVQFAANAAPQTSTANLTVQPTDGFLIGQVLTPAGTPLQPASPYLGTNFAAYIDVWNDANDRYTFGYLSANGTFSVPVVAGHYQVAVGLDEIDYPNYASPPDQLVEVGAETIDLKQIKLLKRSSVITGTVTDSGGVQIPDAIVQAYQPGGGFDYDYTDGAGHYALRVAAGDWNVHVLPPPGTSYLDNGAEQQISTTDNTTKTLDFVLQPAAARIEGTLVDPQGTPLADVDGWAYARKDNTQEYAAIEPVSHGRFSLNVPPGALRVGVFLAPDSQYSLISELASPALASEPQFDQSLGTAALAQFEQAPYEQLVSVPAAGAAPVQTIRPVQVRLARNDAHIRGTLRDQAGAPATGVSGVVEASPAGANSTWQSASLNSGTGTFDLLLTAGTWYLSYDLDSDQYGANPLGPIQVQVSAGQTVTRDLSTAVLDGVLRGQVRDDKQQPLPGTYVWVRGKNFEQFALTDAGGHFTIHAPQRDGAGLARYTIGTIFSCVVGKPCLLDVDPLVVTAAPRSLLSLWAGPAQNDIVLTARGSAQSENVTVSGQVVIGSNRQPVAGASVTFTPSSGRAGSGYTNNTGNYSLTAVVTKGLARVRYTATAGFVQGTDYFTIDKRDQVAI